MPHPLCCDHCVECCHAPSVEIVVFSVSSTSGNIPLLPVVVGVVVGALVLAIAVICVIIIILCW